MLMCSYCKREIHLLYESAFFTGVWQHDEDSSTICQSADPVVPETPDAVWVNEHGKGWQYADEHQPPPNRTCAGEKIAA